MPENLTSPTVLAAIVAAVLSFVVTMLTARLSDTRKAAAAAASQEITVRAQFVQDLTNRVRDLEGRMDLAANRERELVDRYHSDIEAIDRRYRHLVGNLVQRERALRRILRDHKIEDVPDFTGWEQYEREGGELREQWTRKDDPPRDC